MGQWSVYFHIRIGLKQRRAFNVFWILLCLLIWLKEEEFSDTNLQNKAIYSYSPPCVPTSLVRPMNWNKICKFLLGSAEMWKVSISQWNMIHVPAPIHCLVQNGQWNKIGCVLTWSFPPSVCILQYIHSIDKYNPCPDAVYWTNWFLSQGLRAHEGFLILGRWGVFQMF